MKILLLTDSYFEEEGSATAKAYLRSLAMAENPDLDVYVITTSQDKDEEKVEQIKDNLKVYYIYVPKYNQRLRDFISLFNPKAVFKVKKIIREIKPDITHAHNIHLYLSYACLKVAKKYSQVVILNAHDAMIILNEKFSSYIDLKDLSVIKKFDYKISFKDWLKQTKKGLNPWRNLIIRHYLKSCDKILCISQALKDALLANKIKNVEVLYNGIDITGFERTREEIEAFKKKHNLLGKKVVLFGGRLSRAKGAEVIVKAMAKVCQDLPQAILLISARLDDFNRVMLDLVRELNLENNIICTDWLDPKELKLAFLACDVCVYPSIYLDALGTIHLEAMAAKKPVVGTCFGGTPEVVIDPSRDNKNATGYIINPLNTQVMAEKIIELLKDEKKAKAFGQAGFKRVKEKFTLEKHIANSLSWYNRLLK